MFIGSIAFILFFLTTHHFTSEDQCEKYEALFSFIILFYIIGFSALLPLLLPFGVDQMEGASEQSLKSYFAWFFGVLNAGAFVSYSYYLGFTDVRDISLYQIDKDNNPNVVIILLAGLLLGTVSLFIAILLYKFLVNTKRLSVYQPSGDPLGLIWNVTKSAMNKYSQKRRRPSITRSIQYLEGSQRLLDLAKDDHGNNTFENVESVKTFYRIMPLLLALIPYFAVTSVSTGAYIEQNIYLFDQFEDSTIIPQLVDPCIIIILVFLFEFNPVKKRLKFSSILQRVYIGVFFGLASLIFATIVEFVSTFAAPFKLSYGALQAFKNLTHPDDPGQKVKVLLFKISFQSPQFLLMGISEFLAVIGIFEFIYAQSPREMKCFIYGLFQCIRGIGYIIPFIVNEILQAATCACSNCNCKTCAAYHYQCNGAPTNVSYTYLAGTLLFTLYVISLYFLFRRYKKRVRQPREIWYT
ncbi:Solute carrier family 15 member 4-like [Oopsacas minuta]|uniref:Solute carrier family 15 member 4-like n=1 Tax=Oopsacas minuta TaxID=111878 RepID=A0AAV7K9H6_9METZ|nr:Solute carrier family 15 member 4-like [Oopsacas minuta]